MDGAEFGDVVEGHCPDVAGGGEAQLTVARQGRGAEGDGDGVASRPIDDLTGADAVAGLGFGFGLEFGVEIDFWVPGAGGALNGKRAPDLVGGGRVEQAGADGDIPP